MIASDIPYSASSQISTTELSPCQKLSLDIQIDSASEGTINALQISQTNNFGQGPGDQVLAIQLQPREIGQGFMIAIGSASGNLQWIPDVTVPYEKLVHIEVEAQLQQTIVRINEFTEVYPMLAPGEQRPSGPVTIWACAPWFTSPVGTLVQLEIVPVAEPLTQQIQERPACIQNVDDLAKVILWLESRPQSVSVDELLHSSF